jgi:mono/diheme cytochrome c family protein
MVMLGERVYRGAVGGAGCTGCHGSAGTGTALGPNLTDSRWRWSDGSLQGITSTITQGVAQPKQYRAPMPPLGGAQLNDEQVAAVAAYVWALRHRSP